MTDAIDILVPLRVLIVDDSVIVRKILTLMLDEESTLEVVGTASNGKIAVRQIESLKPDLVILDYEMPEMNGLETLIVIREKYPLLPVIVLSAATQRGAALTMELLAAGATDYCSKPEAAVESQSSVTRVREELLSKIHSLFPRKRRQVVKSGVELGGGPLPERKGKRRVDVVAVAISTGGPSALCTMIPMLPANLPVPVVIVQHMPATFTAQLAQRLDGLSRLTVREGYEGAVVEPGQVWIAPGNFHMTVARKGLKTTLQLNQDALVNSCRPAADVLFCSVSEVYGANTLAVVMTGMGTDGLKGSEVIRRGGGQVIAQDEASSVVWSMPGAVTQAGLVEKVLPLQQLADEVVGRVREGRPVF